MLSILIQLAIAAFLVWLILQIPMEATIRRVIVGVAILLLVLWLLGQLGVAGIPRIG